MKDSIRIVNPEASIESSQDRLGRICVRVIASPWFERLARFGYAAKGLVYVIVSVLALQAAYGAAGDTINPRGALRAIVGGPFGSFWLRMVAAGLALYAVWRFVQAVVDSDRVGTSAAGLIKRVGYAVNGAVFANVAFEGVELIVQWSSSSAPTVEDWTALVLARPAGRWLVALAGGVVIGVGFVQFYLASSGQFCKHLMLHEMTEAALSWTTRVARVGLIGTYAS